MALVNLVKDSAFDPEGSWELLKIFFGKIGERGGWHDESHLLSNSLCAE